VFTPKNVGNISRTVTFISTILGQDCHFLISILCLIFIHSAALISNQKHSSNSEVSLYGYTFIFSDFLTSSKKALICWKLSYLRINWKKFWKLRPELFCEGIRRIARPNVTGLELQTVLYCRSKATTRDTFSEDWVCAVIEEKCQNLRKGFLENHHEK